MKTCTYCGTDKEVNEFYSGRGECKECTKVHHKKYYEKNKDTMKDKAKAYYKKRKTYIRNKQKEYYEKNKDYHKERSRKYQKENRGRINELKRRWYQENKEYHIERAIKKRNMKRQRTPAWYDNDKMVVLRRLAKKLSELTGVDMELDHVIPLNGDNVSGLHVHNNIQILPASVNRRKGNRWSWEDQK